MREKLYQILSALAIVMVILFMVQTGRLHVKGQNYTQLNELLADTVGYYELVLGDNGQTINIQEQKIATLDNAIAAGLIREDELKEKNLKKVDQVIRLKNEIKFYEDIIADLPDSNVVVVTNEDCPEMEEGTYLKVPANFTYSGEWVSLAGTVSPGTVILRNLTVRQEPSIFIGYQRQGLFKPLKPVVTVEDKNPYVKTVKMDNVRIQKKPPFLRSPWGHRLQGAAIVVGTMWVSNQLR